MKRGYESGRAQERPSKQEQPKAPVVQAWEEHGTPGAELVAEDLKRFGSVLTTTKRKLEAMPERREFQGRMIRVFEKEGIMNRDASGQLVFDRRRLQNRSSENPFRDSFSKKMLSFFERTQGQALIDALGDLDAIPAEASGGKNGEVKRILYSPKTAAEALDPETIRKADFQIGLWEFAGRARNVRVPGTDVSQQEASIAAVIYHPKYGDGKRDEQGRLMVVDPKKGKRVPISSQWLRRMGMNILSGDTQAMPFSVQEFLEKEGKHLVEFGLVKPEDFLRQTSGNIKEAASAERSRVSHTGEVMMNGVFYYLGRHFHGKPIRIFELAPGKGGIAFKNEDGTERLTYTFRMFDREDATLKRVKFGKDKLIPRAGATDVELTEVQTEIKETRPRTNKRVGSEKAFVEELWNSARVKLAEIPETSQKAVQELFVSIPANQRNDAYAFGKTFGAKGLERLADMEATTHGATHVMRLANELGPLLTRDVFKAYDAIVKEAEQIEQAIERAAGGTTAREIDRNRLKSELLSRAQKLLAETESSSKKPQSTASELLKKLEGFRSDLVLLASVFKSAFKGKEGRAAFDEMKGVTLESRTAEDLTSEDRMGMRAVSFMNWKEIPSMAEYIQKGLEEKITHGGTANRFYMLKKDGDAVAFMRFEDRPDGSRYCGSLNVAPSMRGSGLGEAFFKEALDVEGRDHRLVANVHPKTLAGTAYVERNGFKITGAEQAPTGDPKKTEWGFVIEREPQNDEAPESGSRMTTEYIASLARSGEVGPGGSIAKRYDVRRETSRMKEETTELARRGFVGTRYFADPRDAEMRYILFTPTRKVGAEKRARSVRS